MPRFALKIEYHGAGLYGWQRQKEHPSVQEAVETALRKVDPSVETIVAAGRTDAGVHAFGQVAHVDIKKDLTAFRLSEAVNFHLRPARISIVEASQVADDFNARFDAIERRYLFRLIARRAPLTYEEGNIWHVKQDLDRDAMQEAADVLIGNHDFTTFRSSICQAKSPRKTLDELRIEEIKLPYGSEFRFHVRARSFLHNQVRSFVGTLERVGAGNWDAARVKEALEACDRAKCGPVSPPHGLYLAHVTYPSDPFSG